MIRALVIALVGLMALGASASAANLSSTGTFLAKSLDANGCAREAGGVPSVQLTSWVALGLVASGRSSGAAAACIERHAKALTTTTDVDATVAAPAPYLVAAVSVLTYLVVAFPITASAEAVSTFASFTIGFISGFFRCLQAIYLPLPFRSICHCWSSVSFCPLTFISRRFSHLVSQ